MAQTATKLEELHARGLRENPSGLMLRVATKGGRSTYQTSEGINLQLLFTSSQANVYTVELVDVGHGDEIVLQRADAADPSRLTRDQGVVCCSDVRRVLGQKPTVVSPYFHFRLQPGKYSLFFQTHRVPGVGQNVDHYGEGPIVTSDVLHITVLSDK